MRPIFVLALPVLLTACAMPAAFTIASLAVDGISYATSGKSVSDHAISVVANEDCAMWRVLQGRPICGDAELPETMVAAAPEPGEPEAPAAVIAVAPAAGGSRAAETATTEPHDEFEVTAAAFAALPAAAGSRLVAAPEPDGSMAPAFVFAVSPAAGGPMAPETAKAETPATTAAPADRGTAARPVQLATPPVPLPAMEARPVQLATLSVSLPAKEARPKRGRFVVLASYFKEARARAAMKRGQAFAPRMARVRVNGKLYYRVVSGPYARGTIAAMRRTLIGEGFPDAWTATLCQDTLRLAPCPTASLPLNVSAN